MFSKNESNLCKGIAIILMLFHHLFFDPRDYQQFTVSFAPLTGERVVFYALLSKICVAIFVFISGYGLAASYRNRFGKTEPSPSEITDFILRRVWRLMTMYWFAFALVLLIQPFGRTIFDAYGTNLKNILIYFFLDFLGLAYFFGTPTLNPTWWYMTLALLIIILIPVLMRVIDKMGSLILITFGTGILFFTNSSNANTFYLFSLYLGAVCFEHRIFEKLGHLWTSKCWGCLVKAVGIFIALSFLLSLRTNHNYYGLVDGMIALTLAALVSVLLIRIPVISPILQYLGRYSGNMFLIHTMIYFYCFQNFIYSFKNWILILLALLLTSFAASVLMEYTKKILRYDDFMKKIEIVLFKNINK